MKLAFCGLGVLGAAMARRLLGAGHELAVWNRTPAKAAPLAELGAQVAATPADAARGAEGVLLCLLDAASVEAVVFGDEGLASVPGLPWIADHSSIAPEATRRIAQRLKDASGAAWLDAPVSGGVAGVEAGTLVVMAGGEARHLPALGQAVGAYAERVTHLGEAGTGQAAKLCNQIIVSATVAAVAEAVGFARRQGIAVERLTQALSGGWADSRPFQVFAPRMAQPRSPSIGALSTMLKDVDTALAVAREAGAPLPVAACVQQLLRAAQAAGLGEAELSALAVLFEPQRHEAFRRAAGLCPGSG